MATTHPARSRVTIDEFARLADDNVELIDGEVVEVAAAGRRSSRLGLRVGRCLLDHVEAGNLGEVYGADGGFILFPDRTLVRSPDAAFVRAERLVEADVDGFVPVAPDLAVEVLSPSDRRGAVLEKVGMYLEAGVRLVWLIDPKASSVAVFAPDAPIVLLRGGDTLDGGDVLPGFSLPLAAIFA